MMAAEIRAAERAVGAGVREAAEGLKHELRRQVVDAGLGRRVANAWRSRVYPQGGASIEAAGWVWSKAPKIHEAFDRGVLIRSRRGVFLAIPTEAAGKRAFGKRITPGLWERKTGLRLRFVYRRGAPSLLVAELRARGGKRGGFAVPGARARKTGRGLATVPIFILVPQVKLRKLLDVAGAAERWRARLPGLVLRYWPEERQ